MNSRRMKLSDDEIILRCIRRGVKAIELAKHLDVNRSTISKLRSGKAKCLRNARRKKLYDLYVSVVVDGDSALNCDAANAVDYATDGGCGE